MFYEIAGERFRELIKTETGAWIISYDNPCSPKFVLEEKLREIKKTEEPEGFFGRQGQEETLSEGRRKRKELIAELLDSEDYIIDRRMRNGKIRELAERNETTVKRIQKLYFRFLAGRPLMEDRQISEKEKTKEQKDFSWAIQAYYFSAKKNSLRTTYDLMLLARYTDEDGHLLKEHPSWHCFRHYFYDQNFHRSSRAYISRNGLSNYQRNGRPLFGSGMNWKDRTGAFQMDATQADIYLVSKLDRTAVIGRPCVYLAVDTVTQLIAGIHVGLEAGEQAVISCLANAAMDKVGFCRKYGIDIEKREWPNTGLPGEIITDKGREFIGNRMAELAARYGIEFESLPPFRPDEKGLVEKSFDLIQQKYKPTLRGKGVIEPDAQERWATDYRNQAVLTLEEYTKVIIHCVLYLNSCRILQHVILTECKPVAASLWEWYEEQGRSSVIPISDRQLYEFSLLRQKAKLTRKGIQMGGLRYICMEQKKILERRGEGGAVQIAYDPENVEHIYLLDGMDMIPFVLSDHYRNYAGVTQAECRIAKERQKGRKAELEKQDTAGRIRVLQCIESIVKGTECMEKGKVNSRIIKDHRRKER